MVCKQQTPSGGSERNYVRRHCAKGKGKNAGVKMGRVDVCCSAANHAGSRFSRGAPGAGSADALFRALRANAAVPISRSKLATAFAPDCANNAPPFEKKRTAP